MISEKKIKGCYMHSLNAKPGEEDKSYGVLKKINAQCKAFSEHFVFDHIINYTQNKSGLFEKIRSRLPFTHISEKWVYKSEYKKYDFIYFRKNIIDFSIIRFFKIVKKNNPNCKIIFEIPTYPYDGEEFTTLKDLPFRLKDRINRKKLHRYVDLITTVASLKECIFKCKVVSFVNGLDFDNVPVAHPSSNNETINIIAVALFTFWHGYDRLINGLAEYYKNNGKINYKIYLVGEGVSIPAYKKIVLEKKLEQHVIFTGKLSGNDLDAVYDMCDIACDSLGFYRQNLTQSSTLKSREYLARGLPLIASASIDVIGDDFKYKLQVPNNDSYIDFNSIDLFYNKYLKDKNIYDVRTAIREYARSRIDIKETMKPIISFIKSNV